MLIYWTGRHLNVDFSWGLVYLNNIVCHRVTCKWQKELVSDRLIGRTLNITTFNSCRAVTAAQAAVCLWPSRGCFEWEKKGRRDGRTDGRTDGQPTACAILEFQGHLFSESSRSINSNFLPPNKETGLHCSTSSSQLRHMRIVIRTQAIFLLWWRQAGWEGGPSTGPWPPREDLHCNKKIHDDLSILFHHQPSWRHGFLV